MVHFHVQGPLPVKTNYSVISKPKLEEQDCNQINGAIEYQDLKRIQDSTINHKLYHMNYYLEAAISCLFLFLMKHLLILLKH